VRRRLAAVAGVDGAADGLLALVVFLEGLLHIEVELPLPLDALLFHVSDNALVHQLQRALVSVCGGSTRLAGLGDTAEILRSRPRTSGMGGWFRTSRSLLCWKWTMTMVPTARRQDAPRVALEALDMAVRWRVDSAIVGG
jgi:hypothetical protein